MPSTSLYLIRHAETTWNAEGRVQGRLDAPLSERGLRQVRGLVEALRAVPLAALYSSPLQRAQETARPLADAHDRSLRIADDLREMNQGTWESLLLDEVAARDAETLKAWRQSPESVRMPGGESLPEVQERGMRTITEIASQHQGETIAVVAHGGVNKAILLSMLGAPLASYWRIRQNNACISIVEVDGAQSRVIVLNETAHLGSDAWYPPS